MSPDQEFDPTDPEHVDHVLEVIHNHGYRVYAIDGGKLDASAKFCIADPDDDIDGYYLETPTLAELANEYYDAFGLELDFSPLFPDPI